MKYVRSDLISEVGYSDINVEPRKNKNENQERADISFVDKTVFSKHVHYFTDDTIGHPLCKSYISAEVKDPTAQHTIKILERNKAKQYKDFITKQRTHPAVVAGAKVINYRTIAMTSLGEMSDDTIKFFNGAFSFYKKKLNVAAKVSPRPDGQTPKEITAKLRMKYRILLQFALTNGNAAIVNTVGI